MDESVALEYDNCRKEIKDINDRILKFITFTYTVISALTSWGYKDGVIIAYLISNAFILWAINYIIHCRQWIAINASYCAYYLENDKSALSWEKRLEKFRSIHKTVPIRLYEAIFFIIISISNSVLIIITNTIRETALIKSHVFVVVIFIISSAITLMVIFIVINGLRETRRDNWSKKYKDDWKRVETELTNELNSHQ